MATGPCGPRIEREQILILPAGTYVPTKVTRSRKQGDRGKGDYERPLREGAHRSRPPAAFWLLCRRGQSNIVSPPPRRAEPQRRSAASHKVLLPTFLSRKVGLTFFSKKVRHRARGTGRRGLHSIPRPGAFLSRPEPPAAPGRGRAPGGSDPPEQRR